MALTIGARLGAYEVVAPIGAGGMGEVYRAHDTRLNRDVAIKVLPDAVARDPDRLARFEREAQVLASLNHPYIAHVYGLEESDGTRALVMELVPGATLDQILGPPNQGASPISVDEAIAIARKIAEALEAAHERGVIHRDLKPANVKLTPDGTVKVLDFGLAKALDPPGADPTISPTLTSPALATRTGVVLGTAAYMAPEQASGKGVDKRADIWAFGCVLFEMLTGRPLFGGDTVTETLAAVMRDAPPLDLLPAATPSRVRRLLVRCLQRDPKQRLRDIGEARVILGESETEREAAAPPAFASAPGGSSVRAAPVRRRTAARVLPWAIAAIAVIVAAAAWIARPRVDLAPFRRLEIAISAPDAASLVLSPDGRHIAFVSGRHLRVQDLNRLETRDLGALAAADAQFLFWSRDSAFIGYATSDGKLWKIPAAGGTPLIICTIPESGRLVGAAWRTDRTIVFAAFRGNLYEVPASGGTPAVLASVDPAKEIDFHVPIVMPDGRVIVSTHLRPQDKDAPEQYRIEMVNAQRGQRRETVLEGDLVAGGYLDGGYLLVRRFDVNPGLWAVRFTGGQPVTMDEAFLVAPGNGHSLSVARDGTLLFALTASASRTRELVWLDRTGQVVGQIGSPRTDLLSPALSPDGQRVAFGARTGDNFDVWVYDIRRNAPSRITFDASPDVGPTWFPSGDRIVYTERRTVGAERIAAANADGSGSRRELASGRMPTISRDGRHLLYVVDERGALHVRYSALSADGTPGAAERVFKSDPEPGVFGPRLSPDGSLLAYAERQPSGVFEVFLSRFPSGEGHWQISSGGGRAPLWVRDTGELIFVGGADPGPKQLMSAPIAFRPTVTTAVPVALFDLGEDFTVASNAPDFDASADGKRFVLARTLRQPGAAPSTRWILVENSLANFTRR